MWLSRVRADTGGDRSVYGNFWFEPVGRLAAAGVRVTPGSAMGLPAVFACVRVLAESFAIMPFGLRRPKKDGKGREIVTDHWLYRLIARAPNRFQTPFEWREMLMGHLALRGNAYCQIVPDGRGGIDELLPMNPDRMKVEVLPSGEYRYVYSDLRGTQIRYARGEIWHLRTTSADGYLGMSPIEVCREAIGGGLAMQDYAGRFFANDAKPGGWIEFPGKFAGNDAKETFRASWQRAQGGANKNKLAVLENGMKYHEVGATNKDAQFLEARAATVSDVARIFRVPPHKIGDLSKATFSNIEQQSIEFWQDTMLPWAERWESSIVYSFLDPEGPDAELEVEFDMSRMMRGDAVSRGALYTSGIMSGWLTRNEARDAEGQDPIDGLDEPLVPLNMQTPTQSEETHEAAIEPPPPPVAPAVPVPPTKKPKGAERLDALLAGNVERLTRRAMTALETKTPAQAFSTEFALVVAEALAIEPADASALCMAMVAALVEPVLTATVESMLRAALLSLAKAPE
jgi:HK97 family phage portal protein